VSDNRKSARLTVAVSPKRSDWSMAQQWGPL
jgi:hypothetical protein